MSRNKSLTTVAIRYQALYLDVKKDDIDMMSSIPPHVLAFIARLNENGFTVDEQLLHALAMVGEANLMEITDTLDDLMGVKLNWMPLVKGWDNPTGETRADHFMTWIANIFGEENGFVGERLQCGHLIPQGSFNLERYNGCPFCGTPFRIADYVFHGQSDKLKELRLFTGVEMKNAFRNLLTSPTPLNATQLSSLELLIDCYGLPENVVVTMKETEAKIVEYLVGANKGYEAVKLLKTPMDILRFLWFKKTNNVRIIEPRTLIPVAMRNNRHITPSLDKSCDAAQKTMNDLKLKYDRAWCRRVAEWLNSTKLIPQEAAENMNPKRGMWVRMIRALRLGEYSRKRGFGHLADILDTFYKGNYTTWQGRVEKAWHDCDDSSFFSLMKQKPGAFARRVFASMLYFGLNDTLENFSEIVDKLPARLLVSLANAASFYFDRNAKREVRTITGLTHTLDPHMLVFSYDDGQLAEMAQSVGALFKKSMARRFAAQKNENKTLFVDKALYAIPLEVGNRTETIQTFSDTPAGTRFNIEGDSVRLFLQWGEGLHEQWLDMDLSCRIIYENGNTEDCAYYNLTCQGAKHSGDIQHIPEMVGTAEYIELSIPELIMSGAVYVAFTCNAYSTGSLSPNLKVGWMDSKYPMAVSDDDGVAYDPSCVQHIVTVGDAFLSKGLVFGVLIVHEKNIVWMEMPFAGQYAAMLNLEQMKYLMNIIENKITIGQLLDIKAEAQHLSKIDSPEDADEAYTKKWAADKAGVNQLLSI